MTQKYSSQEITEMRHVLVSLMTPLNGSYLPSEVERRAELALQTHMLNGTTLAELREELQKHDYAKWCHLDPEGAALHARMQEHKDAAL